MTTLVVFWQDQKSSNWTENNVLSGNKVNDGNTLMDFAIWSNAQKSVLPRHDHAALYTGWVSERERESKNSAPISLYSETLGQSDIENF